eukprot:TRINITY_DN9219_c0_g1_i2.p1 TRINITY_DN9219_c0_g1~~TRINITY_DN9219_c0_g1_i2.p1  ORF type:complete len:150 (-),score=14.49 TRINITY_DN9219_c0_g1_i2:412-861(-)
MTRGIDIPLVKNVLNYDAPKNVKTYVHRAGRTARAQHSGRVFTITSRGQEGSSFRNILRQLNNKFVAPYYVPWQRVSENMPRYKQCLQDLQLRVSDCSKFKGCMCERGLTVHPADKSEKHSNEHNPDLIRSLERQLVRNLGHATDPGRS